MLVKREVLTGNSYYYLYNGHGDVVQIEDFKRGMDRGKGDHLPWEVLVEIAEEILQDYK